MSALPLILVTYHTEEEGIIYERYSYCTKIGDDLFNDMLLESQSNKKITPKCIPHKIRSITGIYETIDRKTFTSWNYDKINDYIYELRLNKLSRNIDK